MKFGKKSRLVLSNTLIQVVGKVITSIMGIVTIGILTRYLGVENYGIFTLTFAYLTLFLAFSDLGLSLVGVREISKNKKQSKNILEAVFLIRVALAVISILLAVGFSLLIYPGPSREVLRTGILIVSLASFISIIGSTPITYFQANLKMIYATVSEFLGRLLSFLLMLFVVWRGYSLTVLFWTVVISYSLTALVNFAFARNIFNRIPKLNIDLVKQLLSETAPLGIALVINTIYFRADTIILSLFRSNAEVGLYGLSYRVLEIISIFFSYFTMSVFPIMSSYIEKDKKRFQDIVQKGVDFILLVSVPTAVGLVMLSKQMILILAGTGYLAAQPAVQILSIALAFMFINGFLGMSIIAASRQKDALWLNVTALVVNIILNIMLIPQFGFIAAAYTTLLSELLTFAVGLILVKRFLKFLPQFNSLPRILIAALVMSAFLFNLEGYLSSGILETSLLVILGGVVYAICIIFLDVIKLSDLMEITKLNRIIIFK